MVVWWDMFEKFETELDKWESEKPIDKKAKKEIQ
jgi:hypothetical protein